jgi:transposase-like protein
MLAAWKAGAALPDVGAIGGVSATTAWRMIRRQLGEPPRPLAHAITSEERTEIVAELTEGTMTVKECAYLHHVDPETIRVILRAAGVPPRPRGRRAQG